MAQRKWARSLSVLLALVLWLCLGLVLPVVLSLYSTDGTSDAVEAAPTDAFVLTHAIDIASSPGIRLERGASIALVDSTGKSLKPQETGDSQPPKSYPFVKVFNASLSVGHVVDPPRATSASATTFPVSPFEATLSSGRYEGLSLRRSSITLHRILAEPVTLTDVNAEVSLRRRGTMTIKGSGLLRGRRIAFDATANLGQSERRGTHAQRLPLKLSLKSTDLDFSIDGRLSASPQDLELQGAAEASIPSGRALARWFGAYWPSGPGLRDIGIRGQLRMANGTLAIDSAWTRIDGNEGTGVLGLRLLKPRPALTGTLAFKSFDTAPYLTKTPTDPRYLLSWASFAEGAVTVPLGMHLDADLRISADRALMGKTEFGRIATTVALKDGKLLADIADVRFNGGEGGGQLTADFTGFIPKVGVRGKLDSIDLSMLCATLGVGQLFQGKASIVLDLSGQGTTVQDVVRALSGKLAIRSQSGGRIGVDLRTLETAARKGAGLVWAEAVRNSMPFDKLDMRLVLRDGTILTETAEAHFGDTAWNAVGIVNLTADRMDLRLSRIGTASGATALSPQRVIELHGPLHSPQFKPSSVP
jgi:AsmA protein